MASSRYTDETLWEDGELVYSLPIDAGEVKDTDQVTTWTSSLQHYYGTSPPTRYGVVPVGCPDIVDMGIADLTLCTSKRCDPLCQG